MFFRVFILLLICSLKLFPVTAQPVSTQSLRFEAEAFFLKKAYVEATPKFLQLISLDPKDANLNYKYGVCLLFNATDKSKAIPLLEYAISSTSVTNEAYYYLAKAYHLNFDFDKALTSYLQYKSLVKLSSRELATLNQEIQQCRNGILGTEHAVLLTVLEKKDVLEKDFFKGYPLSVIGGDILVSSSDQSKTDRRNNHVPVIHFPAKSKYIFFSSYGEGSSHKDLYYKEKLADGKWSLARKVGGSVNSDFEEDYPFFDVDEQMLYFSSTGHNSIGGYDIFKVKFDPVKNSAGPVSNLEFAISSPDDDLFFIYDAKSKRANFASSRNSADGKITIYDVLLNDLPRSIGYFYATITPAENEESTSIEKILIRKNGELLGAFYPNQQGTFRLPFTEEGKLQLEFISKNDKVMNLVDLQVTKDEMNQLLVFNQQGDKSIVLKSKQANSVDKKQQLATTSKLEQLEVFEAGQVANAENIVDASQQRNAVMGHVKLELDKLAEQAEQIQKLNGWIIENELKIQALQSEIQKLAANSEVVKDQSLKMNYLKSASEKVLLIDQLNAENKELEQYQEKIVAGFSQNYLAELTNFENRLNTNTALSDQLIHEIQEKIIAQKNENKIAYPTRLLTRIDSLKKNEEVLYRSKQKIEKEIVVFDEQISSNEIQLKSAKEKDKSVIQTQLERIKAEKNALEKVRLTKERELNQIHTQIEENERQLAFYNELSTRNDKSLKQTSEVLLVKEQSKNSNFIDIKEYLKVQLEKNVSDVDSKSTAAVESTALVVTKVVLEKETPEMGVRDSDESRADIDLTVEEWKKREVKQMTEQKVVNELRETSESYKPKSSSIQIAPQTIEGEDSISMNNSQDQTFRKEQLVNESIDSKLTTQKIRQQELLKSDNLSKSTVNYIQELTKTDERNAVLNPAKVSYEDEQRLSNMLVRNQFYLDILTATEQFKAYQRIQGLGIDLNLFEIGPTVKLNLLRQHFSADKKELEAELKNGKSKDSLAIEKEIQHLNDQLQFIEKEIFFRNTIYAELHTQSESRVEEEKLQKAFEQLFLTSNELLFRTHDKTQEQFTELTETFALIAAAKSIPAAQFVSQLKQMMTNDATKEELLIQMTSKTEVFQPLKIAIANTSAEVTSNDRNKIELVNVEKGLVYRIQIGAFSKVLSSEQFDAFKPLTGDKLKNGITRYMTGYFSNKTEAVKAQTIIKKMGYKDAFVVAYCDGKRITLYEASSLEKNKVCVATGKNELTVTPRNSKESELLETMVNANNLQLQKIEEQSMREQQVQFFAGTALMQLPKEIIIVELISDVIYPSEPLVILDQLNRHGNYYYDSQSQRIKSFPMEDKRLPLRMDGFEIKKIADPSIVIKAVVNWEKLDGGLVDWLLKTKIPFTCSLNDQEMQFEFINVNQLAEKFELTKVLAAYHIQVYK